MCFASLQMQYKCGINFLQMFKEEDFAERVYMFIRTFPMVT